ncbi:MAG: NADP-specific glutamate dehydrogenase [Phycisphaerales bacterium]
MTTMMKANRVQELIDAVKPGPLFRAAAEEVGACLGPVIEAHPEYQKARVFERLLIPDRIIRFRVEWVDDKGQVQINNAWRIEHTNVLGPYKGGLRFHPTVTEETLRFLAFEQCFKNAISGLPMGGGKGGSDFDPKGKSDNEVMRFCQSFMRELYRHIGPYTDVPAGDIGVGGREIGFLYGQYVKITKLRDGVLTGKAMGMGGVHGRTEATGYGTVAFAKYMLEHAKDTIEGKRCLISGCGNVSLYAAERCLKLGAKVVSLSDSGGSMIFDKGLTEKQLTELKHFKEVERGRLKNFKADGAHFHPEARPWSLVKGEVALPCATQFEVEKDDAEAMVARGVKVVSEGANMPSTPEAIDIYQKNGVLYGLGKAANAGGVSCSCFEMTQNASHEPWTKERAFKAIDDVMRHIHDLCVKHAPKKDGVVDYVTGANRAGFILLADAMVTMGV